MLFWGNQKGAWIPTKSIQDQQSSWEFHISRNTAILDGKGQTKDCRIPKILLLRSRLIKLLSYKVPSSWKRKENKGVATSPEGKTKSPEGGTMSPRGRGNPGGLFQGRDTWARNWSLLSWISKLPWTGDSFLPSMSSLFEPECHCYPMLVPPCVLGGRAGADNLSL